MQKCWLDIIKNIKKALKNAHERHQNVSKEKNKKYQYAC